MDINASFAVIGKQKYAFNRMSLLFCALLILLMTQSILAQAIVLTIVAATGVLLFVTNGGIPRVHLNALLISCMLLACAALPFAADSWMVSTYYAVSELKVLMMFFLPFFFSYIFLRMEGGEIRFYSEVLTGFFKALTVSYLIISTFGLVFLDIARYTAGAGHSINVAYGLLYLMIFTGPQIGVLWSLAVIVLLMILGSTTAMAIALLYTVKRTNYPSVFKVLFFMVVSAFFFFYSENYREKNFLDFDLLSIDRYQIYYFYVTAILQEFEFYNYVFGYGLGREIVGEVKEGFDHVIFWFLSEFAGNGVYSFASHNDYIRIFMDYGITGLAAILFYLAKTLPANLLYAVCFAAFFNTTLFSTFELIILALIIGYQANAICKVAKHG